MRRFTAIIEPRNIGLQHDFNARSLAQMFIRAISINGYISMANRHRGEIDAEIGGRRRTLVLTLGALAELEQAFAADDLAALAARFGSGRLSARDLVRIIGAGLRGAGEPIGDDEVAMLRIDGGAARFVAIAADLITATFAEAPAA
jgi:hypothetical protein